MFKQRIESVKIPGPRIVLEAKLLTGSIVPPERREQVVPGIPMPVSTVLVKIQTLPSKR